MGRRRKEIGCPKCGDTDVSHFNKASGRANGVQLYCKTCHYAMKQGEHLWLWYKLTPEKYAEFLSLQGGACAVCERIFIKKPQIDHDHKCCPGRKTCGKCIRGLLCGQCNTLLGLANDDSERLKRAAEYLVKYQNEIRSL